ncbi:MAG: hypothetical protein IJ809_05685 [Clostridia bacterium]|nr:hypothetical protein [Clostridia bacterium]
MNEKKKEAKKVYKKSRHKSCSPSYNDNSYINNSRHSTFIIKSDQCNRKCTKSSI